MPVFGDALAELDDLQADLGIDSYSISLTTLEEVRRVSAVVCVWGVCVRVCVRRLVMRSCACRCVRVFVCVRASR